MDQLISLEPFIITLFLFPIVYSHYFNVPVYNPCSKKSRIYVPSKSYPTLTDAYQHAQTCQTYFGNQIIKEIIIKGTHVIPHHFNINLPLPLIIAGIPNQTTLTFLNGLSIDSTVRIANITIVKGKGIEIKNKSGTVSLFKSTLHECKSSAITLRNGGKAEIHDCVITSNHGSGLVAGDPQSIAKIYNTKIENNKACGIYVFYGGQCDVDGDQTTVTGNELYDLRARKGTINIHLDELTCQRNVEEDGIIM